MKKKGNALEILICATMPFAALGLIILAQYVDGINITWDSSFWIRFSVSAVALLFFFFPARRLFTSMYMGRQRIIAKFKIYAQHTDTIYDGHLSDFQEWCEIEWDMRRKRYAERVLQLFVFKDENGNAMNRRDGFIKYYKMDKTLVRKDKHLSKRQRHNAYEFINKYGKIKPVRYEKVLPGMSAGLKYNRLHSDMDKHSALQDTRKSFNAVIWAFATTCLMLTINPDAEIASIIMQIIIRLIAGLWQIFSALLASNSLVNKTYFSELSEKTLFMDEFLQYKSIDLVETAEAE